MGGGPLAGYGSPRREAGVLRVRCRDGHRGEALLTSACNVPGCPDAPHWACPECGRPAKATCHEAFEGGPDV